MLVNTIGKMMACWNMTLFSLGTYACFGVMYCLHLWECDSITLYLSTRLWHHIPYDSNHGFNSFPVCLYVFDLYQIASLGGHYQFCYNLAV
jgi:hypothetical protein